MRRRIPTNALFTAHAVLALNQTAGVLPGSDVLQDDVTPQRSEEWNTFAQKHRNTGDDESLDEAGSKKALNRNSTIDVGVLHAACGQLGHYLDRISSQMLDQCAGRSRREYPSAQDEHLLGTIGPAFKAQYRLVGLPPDDQRIHRSHEGLIAVLFAAARRQPVEATVGPSDEAVDAGADEDRGLQRENLRSTFSSWIGPPSTMNVMVLMT